MLRLVPHDRQTVVVGDNVTLVCDVISDPQPHVKWVRPIQVNGSWVNPKTGNHYYKILKVSMTLV